MLAEWGIEAARAAADVALSGGRATLVIGDERRVFTREDHSEVKPGDRKNGHRGRKFRKSWRNKKPAF